MTDTASSHVREAVDFDSSSFKSDECINSLSATKKETAATQFELHKNQTCSHCVKNTIHVNTNLLHTTEYQGRESSPTADQPKVFDVNKSQRMEPKLSVDSGRVSNEVHISIDALENELDSLTGTSHGVSEKSPRSGSGCSRHGRIHSYSDDEALLLSSNYGSSSEATSRRDSAMNANREATAQILADNLTLSDDAILWTKIKLRYHFMNPCLKYRAKGTKPVKLIVQIIKIIFVTLQLSLFSKYQFDFRLFIDGNFDSFNHLFLWDWEMGYSDPVQRVPNPYAVFHIADFFDSVDYTVTSYFTLTYNALGNFSYPVDSQVPDNSERINEGGSIPSANVPNNQIPPVKIRFTYYNATEKDGNPYEIQLEPDPLEMDYFVFHNATTNGNFSMERWLVKNQITLNWSSLISIELSFSLVNQHIGSMRTYFKPVCYLFDIRIVYDNSRHTGKLSITHSYTDQTTKCISITYEYSETGWFYMIAITVMDCCIIVLAIYSMVLCIRSLQNNLHLRNVTRAIWLKKLQKPLGKEDEAKFVQYWYFIIMFGDASLVAGSLIKIFITFRVVQVYTICAVLLGCATMIVWLGVLKYLNYFDTYNTLLLTLKFSMPNVLRFLVCCLFIYFGFALAGWAVFGPYHYKFRSFVSTMQTMYSLINGDDMFVTFSEMETSSALVYVFNQVWLYVFIGLFIYCVLSLFIGIITETYEHIREAREHVHVKSELERFYDDIPEDPNCTSFQQLRASRMFICVCCMDDHIDNLRHPEHCMQQNST